MQCPDHVILLRLAPIEGRAERGMGSLGGYVEHRRTPRDYPEGVVLAVRGQADYDREVEAATSPEGYLLASDMVESALEMEDLRSPMDEESFHGAAPHTHFDK